MTRYGASPIEAKSEISKHRLARLFSKGTGGESKLKTEEKATQELTKPNGNPARITKDNVEAVKENTGDPSLISLQSEYPALPVETAYKVLGLSNLSSVEQIQDSYKKHGRFGDLALSAQNEPLLQDR